MATLLGSKLVVPTHLCNSGVNLVGNFRHMLLVADNSKVKLTTVSNVATTLDLSLGGSRQVLLVRLLGPARLGHGFGLCDNTNSNNRRNTRGSVCTW